MIVFPPNPLISSCMEAGVGSISLTAQIRKLSPGQADLSHRPCTHPKGTAGEAFPLLASAALCWGSGVVRRQVDMRQFSVHFSLWHKGVWLFYTFAFGSGSLFTFNLAPGPGFPRLEMTPPLLEAEDQVELSGPQPALVLPCCRHWSQFPLPCFPSSFPYFCVVPLT